MNKQYRDETSLLLKSQTYQWKLEIIKGGKIMERIKLQGRQVIRIGSDKDNDVVCGNPSVSRHHAELKVNQEGNWSLHDLYSTHGSKVNYEAIDKTGKELNKDDVFTLGLSKRMFIMVQEQKEEGADEGIIRQLKTKGDYTKDKKESLLEQYKKLLGVENKGRGEQMEGVSWGIQDEREVYDYQNDYNLPIEINKLLRLEGLNDKQRQKIQKYQEKGRELERIEGAMKGGRDKEEIMMQYDKVEEEMQQAEDALRMSVFGQENELNEGKIRQIQNEDTFNQDDFYDRTQQKKKVIEQRDMNRFNRYSYSQLIDKLDKLKTVKRRISHKLIDLAGEDEEDQEVDEYEQYIKDNERILTTDKQKEFLDQLKHINEQIQAITIQISHTQHHQCPQQPQQKEQEQKEQEQEQEQVIKETPVKKVKKESVQEKVGRQIRELAQCQIEEQPELTEQEQLEECAFLIREEEKEENDQPQAIQINQQKQQKVYSVMNRPANRHCEEQQEQM